MAGASPQQSPATWHSSWYVTNAEPTPRRPGPRCGSGPLATPDRPPPTPPTPAVDDVKPAPDAPAARPADVAPPMPRPRPPVEEKFEKMSPPSLLDATAGLAATAPRPRPPVDEKLEKMSPSPAAAGAAAAAGRPPAAPIPRPRPPPVDEKLANTSSSPPLEAAAGLAAVVTPRPRPPPVDEKLANTSSPPLDEATAAAGRAGEGRPRPPVEEKPANTSSSALGVCCTGARTMFSSMKVRDSPMPDASSSRANNGRPHRAYARQPASHNNANALFNISVTFVLLVARQPMRPQLTAETCATAACLASPTAITRSHPASVVCSPNDPTHLLDDASNDSVVLDLGSVKQKPRELHELGVDGHHAGNRHVAQSCCEGHLTSNKWNMHHQRYVPRIT